MKKTITVMLTLLTLFCMPLSTLAAGEEKIVARGIDVSYAQWDGNRSIDFKKVKEAGIDFVIVRIGYTNRVGPDDYFEKNYKAAKEAGLQVGAYWYNYATTVDQAEKDAADAIRYLKGKQLEYPVYIDMEDPSLIPNQNKNLTTRQRTDIALAFMRKMQQAGYMSGVYANKNWFTKYLYKAEIDQAGEIWWAQWPYSGNPDVDLSAYGLWQYASDGKVNGVYDPKKEKGLADVDVDVAYVDYPTLIKLNGLNGFAKNNYINTANKQDINGDGKTDLKDAALMAKYIAGQEGLTLSKNVVNYNGNCRSANLKNVVELVRNVLGLA